MKMTIETAILAVQCLQEIRPDAFIKSVSPNHFGDVIINLDNDETFMYKYENHSLWQFMGTWRNGQWEKVVEGF